MTTDTGRLCPAHSSEQRAPVAPSGYDDTVAALSDGDVDFRLDTISATDSARGIVRLTIYLAGHSASLSTIMPMLHSMNIEVLDERPTEFTRGDRLPCWRYDFRLQIDPAATARLHSDTLAEAVTSTLRAIWTRRIDLDRFNALVLGASLSWREAEMLRAYARYLRQISLPFSQSYICSVLLDNPGTTRALVALFTRRFHPATAASLEQLQPDIDALSQAIDTVTGLDADRILRAYSSLIQATVRTNYFADRAAEALALKLTPHAIGEAPHPRPLSEIFVYSRRVEGVHLRFGKVARGGLRHSDRPQDFRTEILGLAKAQSVKNAVIVPAGAKGGFIVKEPPAKTGDVGADRARQLDETIACYRIYIDALLDVVDNLDVTDRRVLADPDVVRHDGDDTYLVVAADKGTASFSDHANAVACARGFWLGDAFASGGSVGYDHKAMAITARGAWESVTQHFRELGHDVMTAPTSVVGIGDMSGDVFGNGMLLSRQLKLVAAFDHRHIFLDPTPDAATSHAERARLFALDRSSWADYDTTLLSDGGFVVPRTAKRIPLTAAARTVLGIDAAVTALTPNELITAILQAPVDLLWNGGIGTYVKASTETHADAGDKTNDTVRINGHQLRARVIGEGGNLGLTQRGRIEYARAGGRINTDALDNSAGVDCSDHEVNIKIVLDSAIRNGRLDPNARTPLLEAMTDDVADLVLADNRNQNELLSMVRGTGDSQLPMHARLISELEETTGLDRELEALPSKAAIRALNTNGAGLTSPELATLLAYVKLSVKAAVLAGNLPDVDHVHWLLTDYFPNRLRRDYPTEISSHPLRRNIIATTLANDIINVGGPTYMMRMRDETGADTTDVVRAHLVASEVFGIRQLRETIRRTDPQLPAAAVAALQREITRLLDRATRWFLTNRPQPVAVGAEINRYQGAVTALSATMPQWLSGADADEVRAKAAAFVSAGVPTTIADRAAGLLDSFSLLNIVDAAELSHNADPEVVAPVYYALSTHLRIGQLLTAVSALTPTDKWDSLARLALRDDLHFALRALTLDALAVSSPGDTTEHRIAEWYSVNRSRIHRAHNVLDDADSEFGPAKTMSALAVATRQIRSMVGAPGSGSTRDMASLLVALDNALGAPNPPALEG
ncbi:NAD-glutamate dehydrogenase domain-containing protein [Rhodococcus wratislaviensis]|uniref:NAD-glutamate dehydrogenase domain-containing protein n=1 Tax=Rhodococcus wratislaviensis TaxID=44752 RepID=UPI00351711EA